MIDISNIIIFKINSKVKAFKIIEIEAVAGFKFHLILCEKSHNFFIHFLNL